MEFVLLNFSVDFPIERAAQLNNLRYFFRVFGVEAVAPHVLVESHHLEPVNGNQRRIGGSHAIAKPDDMARWNRAIGRCPYNPVHSLPAPRWHDARVISNLAREVAVLAYFLGAD
jgi:hypothetical protein